jgi:hypothetical protein
MPVADITDGVFQNSVGTVLHGILANIGADLDGAVVTVNGTPPDGLTSNGNPLTYSVSGSTLTATANGETVFTLEAFSDGTYEFNQYQILDLSVLQLELNSNVTGGGPQPAYYFYEDGNFGYDDNIPWTLKITGNDSVNPSNGMGISNNNFDTGESFNFEFDDEGNSGVANFTYIAKFGVNVVSGINISWTAYFTDNTNTSQDVTQSDLLDGEYIVIQAPNGAYIDYIEMMANSNTKVKMTSIDTFTLDDSQPEIFDFDFTATDGDGDTVSGSFTLTAQNAPTIEGTVGGDALAGGQGNNTIYGYDGDDILVGGEGDDTLDGGPDDDTMTSGLGADTFKAAEGHDTITDYNQADGDVVDISHVIDYGAGDSLAVSENTDDGTARLSILDSSNEEKGSVSFDNIDYTDDLTGSDPTELLNSLLDQVDVDDGTT